MIVSTFFEKLKSWMERKVTLNLVLNGIKNLSNN